MRRSVPKLLFPTVALAFCLLAPRPAAAQGAKQDWEGKTVQIVRAEGFRRHRWENFKYRLHVRERQPLTAAEVERDVRELWKTGLFSSVDILPSPAPGNPAELLVVVRVREYDLVEAVEIEGASSLAPEKLKTDLRVTVGSTIQPALLKQDAERIRTQYLEDGYHFSGIESVEIPTDTGVLLKWKITEGPRTTVASITFTGNEGIDGGDLEDAMVTKSDAWILGVINVKREPFILRHLLQDIARIKQLYHDQGWLDIGHGDRVFVSNLRFNRDKTRAFLTIHIDEGPRYTIRSVRVLGNRLFTDAELMEKIRMKPGKPFDRETIQKDAATILARYGERAYILAECNPVWTFPEVGTELDLTYKITENDKVFVGTISIAGNARTRDDVIRREFTRRGFAPGEEFNLTAYHRSIRALRDRGWFDRETPGQGLRERRDPGTVPGTQDVALDLTEGKTGNIHFAGGYSSSYGIIGQVDYTQRNFDLSDLPTSLDDFLKGDFFSGGGQILHLRAAPAARHQAYTFDFIEPYFFGTEFKSNFSLYRKSYVRTSWDEVRVGGLVGLERRFAPFALGLSFEMMELRFTDVESDAPLRVKDLEGENLVLTLTPVLSFNTVDSEILPTEGQRISLSWEYAGQILAGDFDYNKYILDADFFFPILELEDGLRHVLVFELKFGYVEPERGMDDVPISERFFLGGRGSIRGFEFHGIGPRENDDPVGDRVLLFASVEYYVPLFTEVLRGAVFLDAGTLEDELGDYHKARFRYSAGFGLRFVIPQLNNIPVSLDFAWPLWKDDDDERRTITFDIGPLF